MWLGLAYIFDLWIQVVPGKWLVDSDLASELVLANLLNSEGSIISKNWFYSTEIRVFEIQWFYRIGLLIFPNNWHAARVFAAAITIAIAAYAFIYVLDAVNMRNIGIWGAGFLILPFGYMHMFLTVWGLYYFAYIIFSLFIIGLILRNIASIKIYRVILVAMLSLMSGLNGIRQPMVLIAPLVISTILILFIFSSKDESFGSDKINLIISVVVSTVFCFTGFLVNTIIFKTKYSFSSFEELYWYNSYYSFETIYKDLFSIFGFQNNAGVFTGRGIASLFGIAISVYLIYGLIVLLKRYREKSLEQQLLILLFPVGIILQGIVFVYLGKYEVNYWLPYVPYAIICICLSADLYDTKISKSIVVGVLSFSVMFCSVATMKGELDSPYRAIPELYNASKWLEENEYNKVVTSFWKANAIVEFTNGKVECWPAIVWTGTPYEWLNEKKHSIMPEGDFALVLDLLENENIEVLSFGQTNYELVYEDGRIQIYYIE